MERTEKEAEAGRAPAGAAVPLPSTSVPSVAERSILCTELLARLHFFTTSHPGLVGQLCQQAQSWLRMCPQPVLVPLGGFLPPPGGPLRATLTGCHKGGSPQRSPCPSGGSGCRYFRLLSGAPLCQLGSPKGASWAWPAVSC